MGTGSSQPYYEPVSKRGSPLNKRGRLGGRKRRRGLLRKIRPVPTTQPILYHSSYRHAPRSNPFSGPIAPPYGLQSPTAYQGYSPYFYNNYAAPYYTPQYQPMMIPQQQVQPMIAQQQQQQQLQQYYQMMMQQQVPRYQPMAMPQQVSPQMFSPYPYNSYPMRTPYSTPYSTPYAQQQPQVQPVYNTGVSAPPASTGITGQNIPYSSPYNAASVKITDWTGGGKISPGFLGPPI